MLLLQNSSSASSGTGSSAPSGTGSSAPSGTGSGAPSGTGSGSSSGPSLIVPPTKPGLLEFYVEIEETDIKIITEGMRLAGSRNITEEEVRNKLPSLVQDWVDNAIYEYEEDYERNGPFSRVRDHWYKQIRALQTEMEVGNFSDEQIVLKEKKIDRLEKEWTKVSSHSEIMEISSIEDMSDLFRESLKLQNLIDGTTNKSATALLAVYFEAQWIDYVTSQSRINIIMAAGMDPKNYDGDLDLEAPVTVSEEESMDEIHMLVDTINSPEDEKEILEQHKQKYAEHMMIRDVAARTFLDETILPAIKQSDGHPIVVDAAKQWARNESEEGHISEDKYQYIIGYIDHNLESDYPLE